MAGSFDTVRASLVALVQEIDQKARELPLYVLPETPQPAEETPSTQEPAGEPMGQPNGGNSGNGGVEDQGSFSFDDLPGFEEFRRKPADYWNSKNRTLFVTGTFRSG